MTPISAVMAICLSVFFYFALLISLFLTCIGTAYTIWRILYMPTPAFRAEHAPPISILKPLSGQDQGLYENLESFLYLDYPTYEVIFFVADAHDPAVAVLRALHDAYPGHFRIILSGKAVGLNPKVANLEKAWTAAKYDTVLVSDSNVRAPATYLREIVPYLVGPTGVVTNYVGCTGGAGVGGVLEELMWNSFYARWMNIAYSVGVPFVIGKSMLFRRSVADDFGGLSTFADHAAEDFMFGQAMNSIGMEIEVAPHPVVQFVGRKKLSDYWRRSLRWHVLQRHSAPVVFYLMPFQFPVVMTALLLPLNWKHAVAVLLLWFFNDAAQLWAMRSPIPIFGWVVAQLLAPFIWVHALFVDSVAWKKTIMKIGRGGWLIEP
jgi:ceramide glucosyltransferase